MKNKCADTVADLLVDNIILRFGMPLVIHSDQGREFENGLMKSLCTLLGCTNTRTAPYHPESDGMIERFNRTCLMMLSMFVNDRRDIWHELLPFVMHAYRTIVHESTGYSPFRLMMGEECSLPQDVSTAELRTSRENDIAPHPFATWVRDALKVAYDHVRPRNGAAEMFRLQSHGPTTFGEWAPQSGRTRYSGGKTSGGNEHMQHFTDINVRDVIGRGILRRMFCRSEQTSEPCWLVLPRE